MTRTTIDAATGEIIQAGDTGFMALDPVAPGGVRELDSKRPLWLATISAGHKVKSQKGMDIPSASKHGEIYVHDPDGSAPGLRSLLGAEEEPGYQGCYVSAPGARLRVAFGSDAIEDIITQRFARRSASALEVYGDQYSLTEIVMQGDRVVHRPHTAGTEEYKALVKTCKAESRMLFCLAEWQGDSVNIPFPDGLGWYSLRFTSRWSLDGLVAKLTETRSITVGRLRGIPFELFIAYQDVPGPDGRVRRIPVWRLEFRPPEMLQLNSGSLRGLLGGAIAEGKKLQLLEAPRETIDDAEREYDVDPDTAEYTEEDVARITDQPRCDVAAWLKRWFALVKGTALMTDDARHDFIQSYCQGISGHYIYGSLHEFLADATDADAAGLYGAAADEIGRRATPGPEELKATAALLTAIRMMYERLGQPVADDADGLTQRAAETRLAALVMASLEARDSAKPKKAAPPPPPPPSEPEEAPSQVKEWMKYSLAEYAELLRQADSLGIDLAGFDANWDTPVDDLAALYRRLQGLVSTMSNDTPQAPLL